MPSQATAKSLQIFLLSYIEVDTEEIYLRMALTLWYFEKYYFYLCDKDKKQIKRKEKKEKRKKKKNSYKKIHIFSRLWSDVSGRRHMLAPFLQGQGWQSTPSTADQDCCGALLAPGILMKKQAHALWWDHRITPKAFSIQIQCPFNSPPLTDQWVLSQNTKNSMLFSRLETKIQSWHYNTYIQHEILHLVTD